MILNFLNIKDQNNIWSVLGIFESQREGAEQIPDKELKGEKVEAFVHELAKRKIDDEETEGGGVKESAEEKKEPLLSSARPSELQGEARKK